VIEHSPDRVRVGLKLPNCGGMFYEPDWVTPENILHLAVAAHDLEFDSVWLHDHLVTPKELQHLSAPPMFDSLISTAAIAAKVPDISVGIAAVILPMRDPVILAKQVMTLEEYFPGRTIIGVGVGRYETEFQGLGSDLYRRRGRVANEYLAIMETLFTESPATYRGEFRSIEDAVFHPKPDASHQPQIWVAGDSAAAARRARRYGSTWIISPAVEPDAVAGLLYPDAVADGHADSGRFPIALTTTIIPPSSSKTTGGSGEHRIHQHGRALEGDSETVAEGLNNYIRVGVDHVLLAFRCADIDAVETGMAWFNETVRPRLAASVTT
jgi:alkanesulfonate monooxygenase SsuD/methylene tetrahydromethanopterin reductase-like flavin-dependent oxidoreductase (luciferase family)